MIFFFCNASQQCIHSQIRFPLRLSVKKLRTNFSCLLSFKFLFCSFERTFFLFLTYSSPGTNYSLFHNEDNHSSTVCQSFGQKIDSCRLFTRHFLPPRSLLLPVMRIKGCFGCLTSRFALKNTERSPVILIIFPSSVLHLFFLVVSCTKFPFCSSSSVLLPQPLG